MQKKRASPITNNVPYLKHHSNIQRVSFNPFTVDYGLIGVRRLVSVYSLTGDIVSNGASALVWPDGGQI
jgi:hypothetical protein